jgi:glycosyltransferase involved in cell wall biosynthesis
MRAEVGDAGPAQACPELSVVLPAKDEVDALPGLVAEIRAALSALCAFEIVVVDDHSSDGTYEAALRAGEEAACALTAIRLDRPSGQSTALHTGVLRARGTLIATLDADGQNDPADIPGMLLMARSLGETSFCIAGYRRSRNDSAWRRWQSRIANRFRSALLRDRTPDTGCGLKLFPRATFLALPYFDHMHRFLPALIRRHGGVLRIREVRHRPRMHGRSKYGAWNRMWAGLLDIAGVLWLLKRNRPTAVLREDRVLPP